MEIKVDLKKKTIFIHSNGRSLNSTITVYNLELVRKNKYETT